jgi:hypothetical protein
MIAYAILEAPVSISDQLADKHRLINISGISNQNHAEFNILHVMVKSLKADYSELHI